HKSFSFFFLFAEQTLAIRKMMDRTLNQVDELTLLFRGLVSRLTDQARTLDFWCLAHDFML
ncbi:Os06g0573500, partial [Oryza sativa Japonica Group]